MCVCMCGCACVGVHVSERERERLYDRGRTNGKERRPEGTGHNLSLRSHQRSRVTKVRWSSRQGRSATTRFKVNDLSIINTSSRSLPRVPNPLPSSPRLPSVYMTHDVRWFDHVYGFEPATPLP